MRNQVQLFAILLAMSLLSRDGHSQGIYDKLVMSVVDQAVPVILYETETAASNKPVGFGSATLYACPAESPTNKSSWVCLVTAKHVLMNKMTGKLGDGLLAKINTPTNSLPRYLKVPLRHDQPRNYWASPSGLDLCVIPLPPQTIDGTGLTAFSELQVVTPETWDSKKIEKGNVVQALCYQWEYLEAIDFQVGHTSPTARFAHISRGGFSRLPSGQLHVRPHVIDMHSSPGNSGAIAIVYVPNSNEGFKSDLMFLGVVQGFKEETSSYETYNAPVKEANTIPLQLVNQETGATNLFAVTIKTVANPNLTLITPVHELTTLRYSVEFITAVMWMGGHMKEYEILNSISQSGIVTNAGTSPSENKSAALLKSICVLALAIIAAGLVISYYILRKRHRRASSEIHA